MYNMKTIIPSAKRKSCCKHKINPDEDVVKMEDVYGIEYSIISRMKCLEILILILEK